MDNISPHLPLKLYEHLTWKAPDLSRFKELLKIVYKNCNLLALACTVYKSFYLQYYN